ncbi:BA3454 family stress response protein [Mesobacillus foraminis]|nr:BA3454 family stress response protein [Mesobacillus foraminis]MBT2757903.1 BA3454 family stress response protein [Mesobacillus foraminis]
MRESYKGRNYQTNLIVNKGIDVEKILLMAKEQIIKQWAS